MRNRRYYDEPFAIPVCYDQDHDARTILCASSRPS
jgi:hypothetical protein